MEEITHAWVIAIAIDHLVFEVMAVLLKSTAIEITFSFTQIYLIVVIIIINFSNSLKNQMRLPYILL